MSSYVKYCQVQAAECVRRAKLASSPELAAERRSLGLRWLRLAEKAQGGTLRSNEQAAIRSQRHPLLTDDPASLRFFNRDTRSKATAPSRARDRSTRRPAGSQGHRRGERRPRFNAPRR